VAEEQFQISESTRSLVAATLEYIDQQIEGEVETDVDKFLQNDSTRVFVEVLVRITAANTEIVE